MNQFAQPIPKEPAASARGSGNLPTMNQFVSRLPDTVGSSDQPGYDALERMASSPEGQRLIESEFQAALTDAGDGFSRRRWLQLMGASLALGAAGCRYPGEQIAEYAFRPIGRIPGIPVHYSTMIEHAGVARPLRATSYDGRPIKLDGIRWVRVTSSRRPGFSNSTTPTGCGSASAAMASGWWKSPATKP
jgi:hypothetical protein